MADTVSSLTIADTSGVKFTTKLTNFSDGTGETLVKKVDDQMSRKPSKIRQLIKVVNDLEFCDFCKVCTGEKKLKEVLE